MNTEVLEAIHSRRSIRKYGEGKISAETIRKILSAAMMAPSAGNAQPWQFIVVENREALDRIKEYSPYAGMAKFAPMGILVCGDLSLEKYPGYWVQDCSAAIQNLLLAAHAEGVGAVWTGIYPIEDRIKGFRNNFSLPETIIPLGFIVMGVPAQESPSKDRFKPERIHYEKW